ncbi:MAG: type IV pilus assembly protein PilB [Parcubacteria group bacterium Gr01-1014_2]|nr:MAG: type IV pilus assembly protein PilB [Parcubacteria group bacterium Gr01-1014_2]
MVKIPQTLVEELLKRKFFDKGTADGLVQKAKEANKDFTQVIIESGLISDSDLAVLKSELYRLPSVAITDDQVKPDALKTIPENTAEFYKFVPFDREGNILRVGVLNPEDNDALEALKFIAQDQRVSIEKYIIDFEDYSIILKKYRTLISEVREALDELSQELEKEEVKKASISQLPQISEQAPIIKAVAVIIKHAVESRASDIHIEPQEKEIRVRFRTDGEMHVSLILPKTIHSAIITRIKILSDLKIDESRVPQDGRFGTVIGDKRIDFRVSTLPTRYGEKVVLRILDSTFGLVDLVALGLDGRNLKLVEKYIEKPFGSILITGPTGSGKTTTLYAILRKINSEDVNIITLEDPIEIILPGINQSQIQEEIGYTFASGLRHILRQDPDIIMVGEIRDSETANLATHASLTGHLVFSTLHTNDSIGVIPRLVDLGVEKYLITPTLNLAMAQRLLRRLCSSCKIKAKADTAEDRIIKEAIDAMPEEVKKGLPKSFDIYKASETGCSECKGKAFKGRVAIFEVLEINDGVEKVILSGISESALREEAKRQGMLTMFQDGILKVLGGMVSLEELLEVAEVGNA